MDYVQLFITSLLSLAGTSRLPPKISIKDDADPVNQHEANIRMEMNVHEYIKSIKDFSKKLHDAKSKVTFLADIKNIIDSSESIVKTTYSKLWENFINNSTNNKENIELMEKIMEKMLNKKLKTEIINNNRTPSKIKNSLKTILNVSPPFTSIFIADVLDKKEQMILDSAIQKNVYHTNTLDGFLETTKYDQDEDMTINMFYSEISKITDPRLRSDYYNMMLDSIVTLLTIKVGSETRLIPIDDDKLKITERIFVQIYLYYINYEKIKTVSDKIKKYLCIKSHQWYTYQITEFPTKLCPNWGFKPKGFILDPWQKNTIRAVDKKQNVLLSLPTSAGKTFGATYVIRSNDNVVYIVPTISLAYQLTGIILASLHDRNDNTKNVRLEIEGVSFKKFPSHEDNIIVATPIEFYTLLSNKTIEPNFDYIIFDEFHNLVDPVIGHYIEYILKFAVYFKIPIMALSATIPNYEELKLWLEKIIGHEIFGVYEDKRFYQLKRYVAQTNDISEINLLKHMTPAILQDPEFKQIGLYPKDYLNFRDQVLKQNIKIPGIEVDETLSEIVTLDRLHISEGTIFKHLKTQPVDILENIFSSNDEVTMNSLTMWSLYNILKDCKAKAMFPMLIFKMDSAECMKIFNNMLSMLKDYQNLVYPNYNGVNKIIKTYFETIEREEKKLVVEKDKSNKKGNGDEEKGRDTSPKDIEDLKDALKEKLFGSEGGVKDQLTEWYANFIAADIEPTDIESFNTNYGAELNAAQIKSLRVKHANKEMKIYNRHENLRTRNIFQPHPECRFMSTSVSYDEMRNIKAKINAEITRDVRLKKGLNAPVEKIGYDHPFLVGIEYGILCYCTLMDPAMQRVCQQLINTNPFITFSDKSLAVGINYPIKTVMLLGTIGKNMPLENISNTLAHQACGRAGRRGHDKEGNIIYAGVDIRNILIPKYTVVSRNSAERMTPLLINESEEFKNFVLNEVRPDVPEVIWKCGNTIDIDKLALEMYNMQTIEEITVKYEDNDGEHEKVTQSKIRTLEQIKTELTSKLTFKPKISVALDQKVQTITSNSESDVEVNNEENVNIVKVEIPDFSQYEDWEQAFDAIQAHEKEQEDKEMRESKALIAKAEASFM